MVNLGGGPAFILGLFLAIAGAGLFFLRSVRPELARDYDIFFAAVGLLCGIILIFNGWRLDPILQFSQFLLTGTAIFFAFESVRMRGAATEQARRNTETVARDRPVSRTRVYTEAELDKIDTYDNVYEGAKPNYSSPRLRGYDDPQPRSTRPPRRQRSAAPTAAKDEPRRRSSRNRSEPRDYSSRNFARESGREPQSDRYDYGEPSSRPPRRRSAAPARDVYDEWDDTPRTVARPRRRPPTTEPTVEPTIPPEPPRRRPSPADLGRSYEPDDTYDSYNGADDLGSSYDDLDLGRSYEPDDESSIPGDFVVDYQPLDNTVTDYSDDDYDDSVRDDDGDYVEDTYDDYDPSGDENVNDDYDDYRNRPERRTPINLNNNDYS